jgi:hypothetical protein
MTKKSRTKHSAAFKAKVAIEAIKEVETLSIVYIILSVANDIFVIIQWTILS